ncbi:uncharacterized protein FIBRA_02701 [Fibroporia radiculosa]|uniref:non-specific serine/threonine protein kinase n=1 Tax=Fibroporia radiculosa TaxID=599839 RepID=J4HVC5_9APHY|nr:uncharacterized protein FIBRA_02701 [Fibroporia radiculosa]CCM00662.1 predicted protein [Fibroporia radiculosa]
MLSTRTKQVYAYGRRAHRIVNASDEREQVKKSDTAKNGPEQVSSVSPSRPVNRRKKHAFSALSDSPGISRKLASPFGKRLRKSPKVAKVAGVAVSMPARHPLSAVSVNVPGSPAAAPPARKKKKQTVGKSTPLKPSSPFIDVDIVVLDARGHRLSQERRVSRSDIQVNKVTEATRKIVENSRSARPPSVLTISPDTDDKSLLPKPSKLGRSRARPIVISSDESDSDQADTTPVGKLRSLDASLKERPERPTRSQQAGSKCQPIALIPSDSPQPIPKPPRSREPAAPIPRIRENTQLPPPAPTFIPWTSELDYAHLRKPIAPYPVADHSKRRQLTPIRRRPGRVPGFPAPPSPPSPTTPTDFDLSIDFSKLAISPATLEAVDDFDTYASPPPPHLRPLLEECSQTTPHEFSAFIEMFPFDAIVRAEDDAELARFEKIGEASYSEVFGIGNVVLKIIPLRNETKNSAENDMDSPAPSDAKDVLKEIIVTRAAGEMCVGFIQLLRTYIVRGRYPSLLLDLWDEYNKKKGSESIRPDTFNVSQVYAIIVLPNGGPDLEAYTFQNASKTGWRQACSLFWQVTRTLAEAEDLVCFEHRDLHWGQILVKNLPIATQPARRPSSKKLPMDHIIHGVEATIIDLGLARMDTGDGNGLTTYWTPFDDEIFEGEGDYQFDIYRLMKTHNNNSWEGYCPLTNVMWLHYLSLKFLHSKRLRPPAASRKSVAASNPSTFTERECYECLREVEAILGQRVAACKPPVERKGRRKTQASAKATLSLGPKNAGDVLRMAVDRQWVR